MHSASLEEGYSIVLVLGFCYYSYRPNYQLFELELILRVHVKNGSALFENHCPGYLEIHQF